MGVKVIRQLIDKRLIQTASDIYQLTLEDLLTLDGFKSKSQKSKNSFLLSLLDQYGKAKWVWKPDSCFSVINHTAIAYSESLGKIFVCGNFDKNATINKATYKGNYNCFIIRLDTNGTFEKTYILSDTSAIFFESMAITSQNELLIGMQYNNFGSNFKLSIPSLGFSINKRGSFLLKLDKDLKPQKISEPLYGNKTSRFLICLKSNNQILSVGRFVDTLRIGSNYYNNGKTVSSTYLTYWDNDLVFKKNSLLFKTLSSSANINSLKSFHDGSILIAGYYIDTIKVDEVGFTPAIYQLYYDYRSPLLIGATSIRNYTLNDIIGIDDDYKFIGKVSDLRMYSKSLTPGEIEQLYFSSDLVEGRKPLIWNIRTGERNYIEEIQHWFQMQLPGSKSKYFNINIHNLNAPEEVKTLIENSLKSNIYKLAPANTSLYKINCK
jgi:hypothetical protein